MAPRSRAKKGAVEDQTYRAGSFSVQGHFPQRRKTVKRKSGNSFEIKRQETLTQLDFTRFLLPEDDGMLMVGDSQEEEDSELEMERPRKKRKSVSTPAMISTTKTANRKRKLPSTASINQRTMTQMLPSMPFPDDSEEENVMAAIELSSQDYKDLSEEEETVKFTRMDDWIATQSQHDGRPVVHAEIPNENIHSDSMENSESAIPSSPVESAHAFTNNPKTPKRVRVLEIPSSQSPAATPISSKLSTVKRKRHRLDNSPLREKSSSRQMARVSPIKLGLGRSPLKERSANYQMAREVPQKLGEAKVATQERVFDILEAPEPQNNILDSKSTPLEHPLGNQAKSSLLPGEKEQEASAQTLPPSDQPPIESPTKQRVAAFNARYAALTREGSHQSARRRTGPFERNQVIRSSTGWSSREDEEINHVVSHPPQPADTQYSIGDETQAILGGIDLALEASPQPDERVEESEELAEPIVGSAGRSPGLGSPSAGTPIIDNTRGHTSGAASIPQDDGHAFKTRSVTQIKEEQFSYFQNPHKGSTDSVDIPMGQLEEKKDRVSCFQKGGEEGGHLADGHPDTVAETEERVPLSPTEEQMHEHERELARRKIDVEEQYISSTQTQSRGIEDSQDPRDSLDQLDEIVIPEVTNIEPELPFVRFEDRVPTYHGEETQWLPPRDSPPGSPMAYESQDSVSKQLLSETEAFATRHLSSPMFIASSPVAIQSSPQQNPFNLTATTTSPGQSSSTRHPSDPVASQQPPQTTFQPPQPRTYDRTRPSQATTVDETQASSTLRTQRHLPSSPIRPTQSDSRLLGSPFRPTQRILVPSSPIPIPNDRSSPFLIAPSSSIPIPPELSSSPSSSVETPRRLRFARMAPVTVSQLIPESLRGEGSLALPPDWTQELDDEDDEL
jgi:hypothetical protein